MCGRYSLAVPVGLNLEMSLDLKNITESWDKPRYNIAPTNKVPVVLNQDSERRLKMMRWGLIPFWSKTERMKYSFINARDDKLLDSKIYGPLLKERRCLIIADGFYEWIRKGTRKIPMHITLKGREVFSFAGLWSPWENPETNEVTNTCTIITTNPNELLEPIHNRMPVILSHEAAEMWIDHNVKNNETLISLLKPFPSDSMIAYQVTDRVNKPGIDSPDLIKPLG